MPDPISTAALLAFGKKILLSEAEKQLVGAFKPHVIELLRWCVGKTDTPKAPPSSEAQHALRYAAWAAAELVLEGVLRQGEAQGGLQAGDRMATAGLLDVVRQRRREAEGPRQGRPAPTWASAGVAQAAAALPAAVGTGNRHAVDAGVAELGVNELRQAAQDAALGRLPAAVVDGVVYGIPDGRGGYADFADLMTAFFLEAVRSRPELFRELQFQTTQEVEQGLRRVAADTAAIRRAMGQLAEGSSGPLRRAIDSLRHSPDLRAGLLAVELLAADKGFAPRTAAPAAPALRIVLGQRARFTLDLPEPMRVVAINADYDGEGHAAAIGPLLGIPDAAADAGLHTVPTAGLPAQEPLGASTLVVLATKAPIASFTEVTALPLEEVRAILGRFEAAPGPKAAAILDYEVTPG